MDNHHTENKKHKKLGGARKGAGRQRKLKDSIKVSASLYLPQADLDAFNLEAALRSEKEKKKIRIGTIINEALHLEALRLREKNGNIKIPGSD